MNDDFLMMLDSIESFGEIINLFNTSSLKEVEVQEVDGDYDLVGVTACPTGIAHTYMAAEQLKKEALEMRQDRPLRNPCCAVSMCCCRLRCGVISSLMTRSIPQSSLPILWGTQCECHPLW